MNESRLDLHILGDPRTVVSSARRTLESMGHHFPLRIQTLDEREDEALNMDRIVAILAAFFGGLALLLASIGLYGVVSYSASRRTSEMGVRRALGAQQRDILWLGMRKALFLVVVGIIIGLPAALATTRLISGLLFGLKPTDLPSISAATLLMFAAALLAGYLPARRASQVDPMVALRHE